MQMNPLPAVGFLRIHQILGDESKGVPPLIPVKRSTWWKGVRDGRFPKPVWLSARTRGWRVSDIVNLMNQISQQEEV